MRVCRFCAAFSAGLALTVLCHAQTFVRVADTTTPIPGAAGSFTGFDHSPNMIDPTSVAFIGTGTGQHQGIYRGTGPEVLKVVADTNTVMPGTTSPFASFDVPSATFGPVFFRGFGGGRTGIYREAASGVDRVIDAEGTTAFGRVTAFGIGGAFRNGNAITRGVPGSLVTDTPTPGGVIVAGVEDPDFANSANTMGFAASYVRTGSGFHQGLITSTQGSPAQIHLERPFTATFQISGGLLTSAFTAIVTTPSDSAIWNTWFSTDQRLVVVGETPIPNGSGAFTDLVTVAGGDTLFFPPLSVDFAFVGRGAGGQEGIYYYGTHRSVGPRGVHELIARGDTLDGRIVQSLSLGRDGLHGYSVAFRATFTDGSAGIYYAVVPEPTYLSLVGLTITLAQRRRRS